MEQLSESLPTLTPSIEENGSFTKCTVRLSEKKDEDGKAFVDAVSTYKECVNISETDALRGLPMLLMETAVTWWVGRYKRYC